MRTRETTTFRYKTFLEQEPEILRSEVEASLKSANTGKAPGVDGISIEGGAKRMSKQGV